MFTLYIYKLRLESNCQPPFGPGEERQGRKRWRWRWRRQGVRLDPREESSRSSITGEALEICPTFYIVLPPGSLSQIFSCMAYVPSFIPLNCLNITYYHINILFTWIYVIGHILQWALRETLYIIYIYTYIKETTRWVFGYVFTGWWFQIFYSFNPTWGRFSIWLLFFRWVGSTTNQFSFRKSQVPTFTWNNWWGFRLGVPPGGCRGRESWGETWTEHVEEL